MPWLRAVSSGYYYILLAGKKLSSVRFCTIFVDFRALIWRKFSKSADFRNGFRQKFSPCKIGQYPKYLRIDLNAIKSFDSNQNSSCTNNKFSVSELPQGLSFQFHLFHSLVLHYILNGFSVSCHRRPCNIIQFKVCLNSWLCSVCWIANKDVTFIHGAVCHLSEMNHIWLQLQWPLLLPLFFVGVRNSIFSTWILCWVMCRVIVLKYPWYKRM